MFHLESRFKLPTTVNGTPSEWEWKREREIKKGRERASVSERARGKHKRYINNAIYVNRIKKCAVPDTKALVICMSMCVYVCSLFRLANCTALSKMHTHTALSLSHTHAKLEHCGTSVWRWLKDSVAATLTALWCCANLTKKSQRTTAPKSRQQKVLKQAKVAFCCELILSKLA